MPVRGRQVTLITFESRSVCIDLCERMAEMGYAVNVWSSQADGTWNGTSRDCTVAFFFARPTCAANAVDAVLEMTRDRPRLGIFSRNDAPWDPRIVKQCDDVVTWPCHDWELDYRLQRTFRANSVQGLPAEETDIDQDFARMKLIGRSPPFLRSLRLITRVAHCDAPVLIEGETGTGKELAARAIHYLSARRENPFIPVNCGAIPDNLLENELFGHERGAFTDAKEAQSGLVCQANKGTLFLDEVETLSAKAQVVLLRFLQDQKFRSLGGKRLRTTDIRVMAASNTDLRALANRGDFRRDLLYRLDVIAVTLPPLRQRHGDVRLLAEHFLRHYCREYRQPGRSFHPDTLAWMERHPWLGNVRELENFVHRAFVLSDSKVVCMPESEICEAGWDEIPDGAADLDDGLNFGRAKSEVIVHFERRYLRRLLTISKGNVTQAAKLAGKERRALGKLLRKHGIDVTTFRV